MENIDWKSLAFGYMKTDCNVRAYYRDGKWSEPEVCTTEEIPMHMAAACLHYGQEAFEGMKAYRGKDGKIRMFRPMENAKRMQISANGVAMAPPPVDMFVEMCKTLVKKNEKFIPPYGSGASFYLRPLLIGISPQIGIKPSKDYMLVIFGFPVGPYFKEGFKGVKMQVVRDFDRAAMQGTGVFKVGGNYAASLRASERAHDEGFASVIFLDAKEKKYIDEAGQANFFAIKGNSYITPSSPSILASITNDSIRTIARDMGLTVEQRPVVVEELSDFDEAGACGTAAVITPIETIVDRQTNTVYEFCKDGKPGPVSTKLYERLVGIQLGDQEDTHGWNMIIE